ncbi:MAG: tetratricopeptide repeat protein [Bacillota bacterium]
MRLKDYSIEELLDLEEELIESKEMEVDGSLNQLIRLYEELYKRISRDKDSEYTYSLGGIKRKLVSYLVRYGTYLKTQYQKDDTAAERNLRMAMSYQKDLPVAYYRLGFLSYKQEKYVQAIDYFQKANFYQKQSKEQEYCLNQQQLYNAHVYLTNSYLYLAEKASKTLKKWETDELVERIPSYERSSLYELINQNEIYLTSHAFTVITPDGKRYCSEEECEQMTVENRLPERFILYFSDRKHTLFFNGKEVDLSMNHAEILRSLFLHTSEQNPATKYRFARIFDTRREDGEIESNTYTQTIRRIREKIARLETLPPVILNTRFRGQTAYYFNGKIPYAVIHRSDSSFILEE